jgi:hypothetical protein
LLLQETSQEDQVSLSFPKQAHLFSGLRPDSLANILLRTNINAINKSVIVVEEISGLIVGAVAERMGGAAI